MSHSPESKKSSIESTAAGRRLYPVYDDTEVDVVIRILDPQKATWSLSWTARSRTCSGENYDEFEETETSGTLFQASDRAIWWVLSKDKAEVVDIAEWLVNNLPHLPCDAVTEIVERADLETV